MKVSAMHGAQIETPPPSSVIIVPLPENILSVSGLDRCWNGVHVSVTQFNCNGRVLHHLNNAAQTRLSVILDEVGQHAEPRLAPGLACPIGYMPKHMLYAPAGLDVWGYSADSRYVRDVTLTFDVARLAQRLHSVFDGAVLAMPRLRFVDNRVRSLVELLASAVGDSDPSAQLYGEGLTAALAACLLTRPQEGSAVNKGLSPGHLRRVMDYMDAHLPEQVSLSDLAALSGLSQWHFSRAFKASTGMAPYRWQLQERVRRSQVLLIGTRASVERVSEATGFANAAHFGRTFRKLVGATPAAWRKAHQT